MQAKDIQTASPQPFILDKKEKFYSRNRSGVLLLFLLIAVSGMEYFYRSQYNLLIAAGLCLFYFMYYKCRVLTPFFIIALLFLAVEIIQILLFGGFNIWTFSGTFIRLFMAFMVIAILKSDFFKVYVRVIYGFSLISLVFYSLSFIPGAEQFYLHTLAAWAPALWENNGFYQSHPNIIVFNFNGLFTDQRNSGPFWEPGSFAVFLMLALLFNHLIGKKFWCRENSVFIICLITTFSTAGYLALFIFLVYLNIRLIKRSLFHFILFLAFCYAGYYTYVEIPFLKKKISKNMELANETTASRFGSAQADFSDFLKSPLVGLGRAGAKNDFKADFTSEHHRNSGIFILLVTYGLPITLIYLFLVYHSFRGLQKLYGAGNYFPLSAFCIFLILAFSEPILLKPLINVFLFIPLLLKTVSPFFVIHKRTYEKGLYSHSHS